MDAVERVEECSCSERMIDLACYGIHICQDGKRLAPEDFYADVPEPPLDRLRGSEDV